MRPGVVRALASWRHATALRELGPDHPATQAADGRRRAAWRETVSDGTPLPTVIACYRAVGEGLAGYQNRHCRQRTRRALRQLMREIAALAK